ncbi:TPA: hypothetical protein ACH3X2_004678 [Trebouxia sp. C0005]
MAVMRQRHQLQGNSQAPPQLPASAPRANPFFFWVTGKLSTLRQNLMFEVPNEPGLSPNNGLENASLSHQSMATNAPREGQAKRSSNKTTSHDGKAGELSTLRQMMEVPNEPGLSPNNGLENALLSDQSMASNPRKGQAKRSGAKTTSHDGKAGHVMTHVCHCVLQED